MTTRRKPARKTRGARVRGLVLACCCTLSALWACTSARADSLQAIFDRGNAAYFRGDFEQAAAQYQQLTAAGIRDPDVFMNLGLARAKNGELGRAILAFERALRVRPDDDEAVKALAMARSAAGKKLADKRGEAVVETRPPLTESLVRPFRQNTLAIWALVLDATLFITLIVRRFARGVSTRTGLGIAASVLCLGALIAMSALYVKRGGDARGRPAIVLREEAPLREAPDPRAPERAQAYEGGSARVLAQDGAFFRVRTAAGAVGWIASRDIGIIDD